MPPAESEVQAFSNFRAFFEQGGVSGVFDAHAAIKVEMLKIRHAFEKSHAFLDLVVPVQVEISQLRESFETGESLVVQHSAETGEI